LLLFGIFGNPVTHSISPCLHNAVFKAFKLDGCYGRFPIIEPSLLFPTFHDLHLEGANVTVPHKEVAYEGCDEVRGIAKKIGAVNTLVREGSRVIGYNTDAEGFYQAVASFGALRSALILGAGGTAKAIAFILKEHGIETTILNRSDSRLDFFKNNGFTCNTWESFTCKSYDLIINTTSAGLKDEELPCPEALLNTLFAQANYAFEVIYNKQTPFLKMAHAHTLACKDGKEMLLHQAVLAFNLFFGNRFEAQKVEICMREIFTL
jgi:shikimate dehydrogenase